jgi:hypothetical protein
MWGVTTHVTINRAPVLTLWASVVARCLGFHRDEALTMGRVVAGLNAFAKGKALGLYYPRRKSLPEERRRLALGEVVHVRLLQRALPAQRTPAGLRALSKDKPVTPESVQRYLETKFGASLHEVESAMLALARSLSEEELAEDTYHLYEAFRPQIPPGIRGWGAAGDLDTQRIRGLIKRRRARARAAD